MTPALTVKSQVTIPKPIRDFMGVGPGSRIKFETLPNGRVAISAVAKAGKGRADNPFAQFRGIIKSGMTTDELMRMTRGEDWNRA
jgi:antitoxin PrlF